MIQQWLGQQRLAQEIHHLVNGIPAEFVVRIANVLAKADAANWSVLRWQVRNAVAQPHLNQRLDTFLDFWQAHAPDVSPESVAMGLLAAAAAQDHYRQAQQLELVWTGPDSQIIPLRRTDQALLQLIHEAQADLHVVSFAVYKVQAITDALIQAAQRGVSISIYLETPDASKGKIGFDTIGALGEAITRYAKFYIWPLDKRDVTAKGRHGSLHAKIALADGRIMLISSANLTEYALTLNMEMGVLVRGGPQPGQVKAHLERLVEQGVFELV
jgi:phosphatidylserine/phosphatidylglycerophosphate/cardiolipin synthase-like enzyme